VVRFLRRLRRFRHIPNLTVLESRGCILACCSQRPRGFLDVAGDVVGSMGFIGPASVRGIAGVVGAAIAARYAGQALRDMAGRDGEAVAIDFRTDPPGWESTDDRYWYDVMDFFEL
jgi:hypothetical protein